MTKLSVQTPLSFSKAPIDTGTGQASSASLGAGAQRDVGADHRKGALDRFEDRFVGAGFKDLAGIAKISRDMFARPPAADPGLGAGASPLDQLGKTPDDTRRDDLLDTSGSKSPNQRNSLAPSTDRSALYGGIARSGDSKDAAPVPGQTLEEPSPGGNGTRTRTIHRDGSVVTDDRRVEEDGTVSATHSRARVDGSETTTTTVVDPSGRWFRTREHTDANGQTTGTFRGDRSLFYSRLTRPNIEGNPNPDQSDASLLPPWVKVSLKPPKSPDRERPVRDDDGPTAERLAVDPEDLVSDPRDHQVARDVARERLGEIDRKAWVLPPRPQSSGM